MSAPKTLPKAQVPDGPFLRLVIRLMPYRVTHYCVGALILLLHLQSGPHLTVPILFVLPVSLAAWFCPGQTSVVLAVLLPLGRAAIGAFLEGPTPPTYVVANAGLGFAVLLLITSLTRRARQTGELERKVAQLEDVLPICSFCKRIRDEDRSWHQLESYISARSTTNFTHSVCPECVQANYGEILGPKPGG